MNSKKNAYILRILPGGVDKVPDALESNQIIIGWSEAFGLINEGLNWKPFRKIISDRYYSKETNMRKAGSASGHMWRFIKEMKIDDLVVIPYGSSFYVARIISDALHIESKVSDDSAYRRNVEWLNGKKPIKRSIARAAFISRMKIQGTTASASDLVDEIEECVQLADQNVKPTFNKDLHQKLVKETLHELRNGRIDSFGFEHLIKSLMLQLGAIEAYVVPRSKDVGADIIARFLVAGSFQQTVAIQAKHWQPNPPVGKSVVKQLITGIEAEVEPVTLGMVITTGEIDNEAEIVAEEYFSEKGIKIELVDGEQFAKLIVEHGVVKS